MAMEAKALYGRLTAVSGVTDLVSTRIYANAAPAGIRSPYIVYQQISGPRVHTCDGPLNLTRSRYQITCWSDDQYDDAEAIAEAVRVALDGYSGTVAAVVVRQIMVIDEADMPFLAPGNEIQEHFGKRLDVQITFVE